MSLLLLFSGEKTFGELAVRAGLITEQAFLSFVSRVPVVSADLALRFLISAELLSISAFRNTLAGDPVQSELAVRNTILEETPVQGLLTALNMLKDPGVLRPQVSYDLFLDGASIKSEVESVSIRCHEDAVHNEISISSFSKTLFEKTSPQVLAGTERLKLQVGSRTMYFLLETRSGSNTSFSLYGRSGSAMEDTPHEEDISYALEEPMLASTLASSLMTSKSVDWQCTDWVVPASFEFNGPPLEGVCILAASVGAVVRSKDNGDLLVRKKMPVRPVDMQSSLPVLSYSREVDIIQLSYDFEKGLGFDCVEVLGERADIPLPDLVTETESPYKEEDVCVRAHWTDGPKPDDIELYVSDGYAEELEDCEDVSLAPETVIFSQGEGSVSYPIDSLISVVWDGADGGDISFNRYSKTLTVADKANCVGLVTYTSLYTRYRLFGHNVDTLLFVVVVDKMQGDVSVFVVTGEGVYEAEAIEDSLLSSEAAAKDRAIAWLDTNKYDTRKMSVMVPYTDDAIDGSLVKLDDGTLGITGNCHIAGVSIEINGPRVVNKLEVRQWLVS